MSNHCGVRRLPRAKRALALSVAGLALAVAPSAIQAGLVQHLTATDAASITASASNVVGVWADQSGNGNNASAETGSVTYPAATSFPTGTAGLQFGPPAKSLRLLDAAKTAALLDFGGTAPARTGFSILLSVKVDQLVPNGEPNDLIGVTTVNTAGGFGLRLNGAGQIVAYLGGTIITRPSADRKVAAGDTVVIAVNYDAGKGRVTLWDSLNNSEFGATVPRGNFAGTGLPLQLGSMGNAGRYLAGSVGEVRVYDTFLPASDFGNVRTSMHDRWVRRPLQHLDATAAGSVAGNPVTQWTDQSGNTNNASAGTGGVTWPATNLFATGVAGVQFGPPAKSLQLLDATKTAGLLNFSGAASTNSGFSVLVSIRVDALSSVTEPNDILGVTTVNTNGGFGLRLNSAGQIVTYLGGTVIARPSADRKVVAGNTVVIAVNYDASTGGLTLWDSLNGTEVTATVARGNFAGSNLPLRLGGLENSARFLSGSVGEVKLFAAKLEAPEFAAQRDALTTKWMGASPTFPTMPAKPVFTVAQLLAWDPAADPDAPFNVATVPLKSRFNVFPALKANAHARSNQGGVQALDTYAGNRPQGGSGSVYTFTYWQYLEESVYWGGISSINIVPPTAEMIDNAHRNGVPNLGTVFFPPLVYGGNYAWVQSFLAKDGDTFPAADKLIAMAEYYGFDGWFINQETEGGTAADAAAMRDLIRYIRQNSNLRVTWYDSMTEAGNIQWQDHLNAGNDWYLRHNYTTGQQNSSGEPIAHSMFIDFSNDSSTSLTTWSRDYANALGVSPYRIWTGIEAEGEDFRTSTAARIKMDKIFPEGQNHLTSVGIYKPLKYASQLPEQDLFWTGAGGDPRDTSATVGTGRWRGLAHNIPERSVIDTLPFSTDFNLGRGANFYRDGAVVKPGTWWNRALQSILPTWRWIIDSTGTKLTPELWDGDAYHGGGCLRVSGKLDADNTLRLYLTDLTVTAGTRLKIAFKRPGLSGVDSLMQAGVSFAAAPANFTYYPAGACSVNGWNEAVVDLSAHAGKRIAALALKFASGTAVPSYEIRIGRMAVYDATAPAPEPPSCIEALDVVAWNGTASGRVRWTHAAGPRHGYNVFLRLTDGSLAFAGSTVSNHFYFENIPVSADYSAVVVQTIGADASESRLSDEPAGTAPVVSAIDDVSIPSGGSTGALSFSVADADTPLDALEVTVGSSNAELVPETGLVLGGAGAERTVTVTPVPGRTGTAVISVAVGDGRFETSRTFLVTVTGNYLSWATGQGVPGASASGDPDGDGLANLAEYAMGTDPAAAGPPAVVLSGSAVTYSKGTAAIAHGDVSWAIESSGTLAPGSWITRVTQAAGDPSPTIGYDFMTGHAPKHFFRLRVVAAP